MNSKYIALRQAVARVVPKHATREELNTRLGFPEGRINALLDGTMPTLEESKALAKELGGEPEDYRDFVIQEDPWFAAQSGETQTQIARLLTQGLRDPLDALKGEQAFSKKASKWMMVAGIVIVASLFHGAWINHKYNFMRPEGLRYGARVYGYRDMAIAQASVEEVKARIQSLRVMSDWVDKTYPDDPASAAKVQRFLLDLVAYWKSVGHVHEDRLIRTTHVMETPSKLKMDNRVFDTLTSQEVDVEDPNGGKLDIPKVRELVRLQLRADQLDKLAEDAAKGRIAPSQLPRMDKWYEMSKEQARTPSVPTSSVDKLIKKVN